MTRHQTSEFTRPGAHSAKNAHQAGAPNTQESGEIPMVGKATLIADNAVLGTAAYNAAFLFGGMPKQDKTAGWTVLALVAELDETREENTRLRAELDAANDAVLDLLHEVEAGGRDA